jgi:hypothetical protein
MSGPNDGPLSRWSRRKQAARRNRRGSAAPVPVTSPAEAAAVPGPSAAQIAEAPSDDTAVARLEAGDTEPTVEEIVASLPDIEELDAASDYTGFLAKGVPEHLARAALRKLWLSDPVFANLDGLNDYDQNFNLIDKVIQLADTNYKVGRGMIDADEAAPAAEDGHLPDAQDAPKAMAMAESPEAPLVAEDADDAGEQGGGPAESAGKEPADTTKST